MHPPEISSRELSFLLERKRIREGGLPMATPLAVRAAGARGCGGDPYLLKRGIFMDKKRKNLQTSKARIFLVDDHDVVRKGLKHLLEAQPDFAVCGEAEDGHQALKALSAAKAQLVIADLSLDGGMSGLDLVKNIKERLPQLPVLVMSMHDESVYAERAFRAGARGYLMKSESAEKVTAAVRQILVGKPFMSEKIAEKMMDVLTQSRPRADVDSLSDREMEVFQRIGRGLKTSRIAEELNLSVKTVESYREQIKVKLNLENASELLRYAVHWAHEHNAVAS